MAGFIQMGLGMVGGLAIAAFADPVLGLGTIVPAMGLIGIVSWVFWQRLPEPALATVKASVALPQPPPS